MGWSDTKILCFMLYKTDVKYQEMKDEIQNSLIYIFCSQTQISLGYCTNKKWIEERWRWCMGSWMGVGGGGGGRRWPAIHQSTTSYKTRFILSMYSLLLSQNSVLCLFHFKSPRLFFYWLENQLKRRHHTWGDSVFRISKTCLKLRGEKLALSLCPRASAYSRERADTL